MSAGRFRPGDPAAAKYGRRCYGGWDLYVGDRQTRCLLRRPNRLPEGVPRGARTLTQIIWPEPSLDDARACLAAIMANDLTAMRQAKALYPRHQFGFEPLIESVRPSRGVRRFRATSCALGPLDAAVEVAASRGEAWFEVTLARRSIPLTRVRVERDGRYEVVLHRPGRYRALGLDAAMWHRRLLVMLRPRAAAEQSASSDASFATATAAAPATGASAVIPA